MTKKHSMERMLMVLIFLLCCITSNIALANIANASISLADKSLYQFENTKRLVTLVENAATLIEQKGEDAFKELAVENSQWNNNYYIFISDIHGINFLNSRTFLAGKNLINFKDIDGRPLVKMITDVIKLPGSKASDWIFYKWEDPNNPFFPQWKSSYIRKAIAPNHKIYLVGSGLYNMKIERIFIETQVNKAAQMLLANDQKIENGLINKLPFFYYSLGDNYIVVMDQKGKRVVDPNFPSLQNNQSIIDLVDKYNKGIKDEFKKILNSKIDHFWVTYLWPNNGYLIRRMSYMRRIQLANGDIYYVGSGYYPIMPIWMSR